MGALSQEQSAAAHATERAVCLLAGAGSGKTRTLVARVRWLVETQGVDPASILAVTFSRKARAELEERLAGPQGGGACRGVTVATFHSLAYRLLRDHGGSSSSAASSPGEQAPLTILADEGRLREMMRDVLAWDRLDKARPAVAGWLFMPPHSSWHDIAATAAERHPSPYRRALLDAAALLQEGEGGLVLPPDATLLGTPFPGLHPSLQLWTVAHLTLSLCRTFGTREFRRMLGDEPQELFLGSQQIAAQALAWAERYKQTHGRLPRPAPGGASASAAAPAGRGVGCSSEATEAAERVCLYAQAAVGLQAALARMRCVALSDLLPMALELLTSDAAALAAARARWRHLLIDEAQDSTGAQLELAQLLAGGNSRVMLVGDSDQSIYSFLAAKGPAAFEAFRRDFDAVTHVLQDNYRSTAPICAFASALLRGNRREGGKALRPVRQGPAAPVVVTRYATAWEEAAATAALIARLHRQEGVPLGSVAVLFRCLSHRDFGGEQHAPLMAALQAEGLPYRVAGRAALGEEAPVRAVVDVVNAATNPADDSSFLALLLAQEELCPSGALVLLRHRQISARLAGRPASLLDCARAVCSSWLRRRRRRERQHLLLCQQAQQAGGSGIETECGIVDVGIFDSISSGGGGVECRDGLIAMATAAEASGQEEAASDEEEGSSGSVELLLGLLARLHSLRQELEDLDLPAALRAALRASGYLADTMRPQTAGEGGGVEPAAAAVDGGAAEWAEAAEEARLPASLRVLLQRAHEYHAVQEATDRAAAARGAAALQAFIVELALDSAVAAEPTAEGGEDAVLIGTIHSAKGLEWPVVILPHVNEGMLPTAYKPSALEAEALSERGWAAARAAHLEEERRLFHVAASRAQDRLFLSYVQAGSSQGGSQATSSSQQPYNRWLPAPAEQDDRPPEVCSGVLAAAIRLLRRQQPDMLQTVNVGSELPDSGSYWYGSRDPPPVPAQPCNTSRQCSQRCAAPAPAAAAGGEAGCSSSNVLHDCGNRQQEQQLSVAERTRQEMQRRQLLKAGSGGSGGATGGTGSFQGSMCCAGGGALRRGVRGGLVRSAAAVPPAKKQRLPAEG